MVKDRSKACMFQACLLGQVYNCFNLYNYVRLCFNLYSYIRLFCYLKGCYGSKHVSQKIASRGQSCKLLLKLALSQCHCRSLLPGEMLGSMFLFEVNNAGWCISPPTQSWILPSKKKGSVVNMFMISHANFCLSHHLLPCTPTWCMPTLFHF